MSEQTWHAFEVATGDAYDLGAYLSESERDEAFQAVLDAEGLNVETYALGTVTAPSLDAALDAIRIGDWDYTQLC